MHCTSQQEVREIITEDPFFQEKLAEYDITVIIPTMAAEKFAEFKRLS